MTPAQEIPFEEMCHHAMNSLLVNGLTPGEWRWGADAIAACRKVKASPTFSFVQGVPKGALLVWHGLPVFPMRASGAACVAKTACTGKIVWMNKPNT